MPDDMENMSATALSVEEAEAKPQNGGGAADTGGIMSLDPGGGNIDPRPGGRPHNDGLGDAMSGAVRALNGSLTDAAKQSVRPQIPQDGFSRFRDSISAAMEGARRQMRGSGLDATQRMVLGMAEDAWRDNSPQTRPSAQGEPSATPGGVTTESAANPAPKPEDGGGTLSGAEAAASRPAIGGAFAQATGITLRPGRFGGRGTPTYQYGGVRVDLPGDLDLNDDAAVRAAVAENNRGIDFMRDAYKDEEV